MIGWSFTRIVLILLTGRHADPKSAHPTSTERAKYAERTAREQRPAGVIEAAIKVARIATGEIGEDIDPKSAAAELGSGGGKARASRLTPEERREIAHCPRCE